MTYKMFSMSASTDEEEIQRICIALTQDKASFLYRYRGKEDGGGFYWTLSTVLSLREHAVSQFEGSRLSEKEISSLAKDGYGAKALNSAAWEVKEALIMEMCDADMLTLDEEKHQARGNDITYRIGEQLIKKWNL